MIVIPMAGLSKRFQSAGYKQPKYMLYAGGEPLFHYAIDSFKRYFLTEEFLFICLDLFSTPSFIEFQAKKLGLKRYRIVVLSEPTRGQAETVYMGLREAKVDDTTPLLIFNIDTFRPSFELPVEFKIDEVDGYLETFIGSGRNWSNVVPRDQMRQTVEMTAEKQEISEFCCTGLYYWRRCIDFRSIFERHAQKGLQTAQAGEFYISPMYNDLISTGGDVRYSVIDRDDVIFCGVPSEFERFLMRFD